MARMQWKEIALDDRRLYESYFGANRIEIAELTFPNLYLRHFSRVIRSSVTDGMFGIEITYHDKKPIFTYPLGKDGEISEAQLAGYLAVLKDECESRRIPVEFLFLTESQERKVRSAASNIFTNVETSKERDHFDYVYRVAELQRLEGSKYHGKKNFINRFTAKHQWVYEEITVKNVDEIIENERIWCEKKSCDETFSLDRERSGIIESLGVWDRLGFMGGAIRAEGKIVAFTMAASNNRDTAVIHIEKGDPDIDGTYPMINREFLLHQGSAYTWVNREDDVGIEGLRQAKLSYHPDHMVEKWRALLT